MTTVAAPRARPLNCQTHSERASGSASPWYRFPFPNISPSTLSYPVSTRTITAQQSVRSITASSHPLILHRRYLTAIAAALDTSIQAYKHTSICTFIPSCLFPQLSSQSLLLTSLLSSEPSLLPARFHSLKRSLPFRLTRICLRFGIYPQKLYSNDVAVAAN